MEHTKVLQALRIALPALLCTLLWGSAFPFIKLGYAAFRIVGAPSQILFAGLRFALAGLLVLAFTALRQKRLPLPPRGGRWQVLRLGLVLTAGQYLFFYTGLANTTGVKGSIIQGAGTFLTVILAHFFLKGQDRMRVTKALGCAVGFSGVVLVNLEGMGGGFSVWGEGFLLIATSMFAIGSLMSKQVTRLVDPLTASGWQLFVGGLVLTVVGLVCGGRLTAPDARGVAIFLYLAALSSVAFTLWTALLQKHPAGKVAVYNFLTPVFGVLLSALLLSEHLPGWITVLALALVCVGIVLVNRPGKKEELRA